jgi:predicted DNA-binding protein
MEVSTMKGITIKLPETTLRRLKEEARASGRSVAALIRERVEAPLSSDDHSVFAMASDLAGSVAGGRKAATNSRRKFRRA